MNSQERREARYQRRKAKRQAKRQARSDALGGVEKVFSYGNLFRWGTKCCNNVRWKQSTQNFELHLFSGTAARRRKLLAGKWKPQKGAHFMLCERGKVRPIDAPHINDRQIEKVLTKEVLIPLYAPEMIYDNGASQEGKGLHFAYRRLKDQLRWHYRRYGTEGYVLLLDFHHFFPGAPHEAIYAHHRKMLLDEGLRAIADTVVSSVPGGVGMPLGVEPSQQEMVSLPSPIDNYAKCQLSIRGFGHYMDDYYALFHSKEDAQRAEAILVAKAEAMGLTINPKKCRIVPLRKFRFCKVQFLLTETGRVVTHGCRDGMKRARRKLRSFLPKVQSGAMTLDAVKAFLQSQVSYYQNFNDHGRVLKLRRLYHAMYGELEANVCATS